MSARLTLARAIEDAGIERGKAERVASAIVDLIHDTVATKADVTAVRTELKADIVELRTELKADIAAVRTELRTDVATVGADLRRTEISMKADIASVRSDLILLEHRMLIKLGVLVFTAAGIIIAAIRYLPAAGHGG